MGAPASLKSTRSTSNFKRSESSCAISKRRMFGMVNFDKKAISISLSGVAVPFTWEPNIYAKLISGTSSRSCWEINVSRSCSIKFRPLGSDDGVLRTAERIFYKLMCVDCTRSKTRMRASFLFMHFISDHSRSSQLLADMQLKNISRYRLLCASCLWL